MTEKLGAFADTARARERELANRLAASVAVDGEFQTILQQAVNSTVSSRQRLDALESEIRESAAAWPGLDTPAGSRQFQRYLTAKTREIHQIVTDAAADNRHRAHLVQTLLNRYIERPGNTPGR